MSKNIYYESVAVDWVSQGISDFFSRIGYSVCYDTVGERREKEIPLDRIYVAGSRKSSLIFALQFKAPYANKNSLYWKINAHQNHLLRKHHGFIWYAFPYFHETYYYQNAIQLTHFLDPVLLCESASRIHWDKYALYSLSAEEEQRKLLTHLNAFKKEFIPVEFQKNLKLASKRKYGMVIPYDSWGTFYYKLLNRLVGFKMDSDDGICNFGEALKACLKESIEIDKETAMMILSLNEVEKIVNIISVITRTLPRIKYQ